jgi:thioredoxin reductase (NADPH)
VGIVRDEAGYLMTGPDLQTNGHYPPNWPLERDPYYLETNIPGVFAAGDVRHGSVKRCASAVGEGAMAVTFVHRYVSNT